MIGLGDEHYRLAFCLANRPMIDHYPQLDHLQPLAAGELSHIVSNTSNHWRKVFNVFAKFLYQLCPTRRSRFADWQSYRDQQLLQSGSGDALLFSPPPITDSGGVIHIVAGKTYATQLGLEPLHWLDQHFALHATAPLIVSPYLDYRQLSNERIDRLVDLVAEVEARKQP
ncbi:MAG: hypothetical protein CL693_13950 [Cellvibrionaceae bacterium]|nr:hypothetical protein [Cellvibrionaceae bacterium]|tara:strand:+ start:10563 stop:11072 length:510 start_codon:yes stop_codon:yes gene_type:complete